MSCCQGSFPQDARPGTARVLVTELSRSDHINPTPAPKSREGSETPVELYLSPEKLELLCGSQELSQMTSLELCIDTQENTLGNFGNYLPNLVQLKMNNSIILSVRDLGTTLSHLQVLSVSQCCLQDLDGISTLSSLRELYAAYNSVSDLSQISMLENLQLLDLEGNNVSDLVQVQYLGLCSKLHTLTLEGNPVSVHPNPSAPQTADYSYRAAVRELVPQLRYLDNTRVEEDGLSSSTTKGEDWAILRNSIIDCNSFQIATEDSETAYPFSRPSTARRPTSSLSCVRPLSSVGSRPHTGSRPMSANRVGIFSPPGSRPGSANSDIAALEGDTSTLTHGAGKILFCGNPVQAIRARREKLRTAPTMSTFTPRDLPIHVPEHTYDLEEPDVGERCDVFAELRAWRDQHSKCLQAIEMEKCPQVLTIHHDDVEEEEDSEQDDNEQEDEDEKSSDGMRADSSDEEHEEEKHSNSRHTASPDSSFHSLSPDMNYKDALFSDVSQPCLETTLSPSPPLHATAVSADRKPPGIRARRLRLSRGNAEILPDSGRIRRPLEAGTTTTAENLPSQRIQQVTNTKVSPLSVSAHIPCPPLASVAGEGQMNSRVVKDLSCVQSVRGHQTSKLQERPLISRPHTARAALQKHHQHHSLQPCRGSSQPD
ncbi:leucine-rich repeat-containing protein 56 [Sphaeramia orbicularis]|uniref:leucine-rich repeat-containing protein 56 n=1 Tax=Sphaeramia orbicularis TaxID=375764 RepID=UPI00117E70CC|nr:leucine-rich repeat-containing protein 56 [Sphaeramia orbicularis]